MAKLLDVFSDETKLANKIPTNSYLDKGDYPIFDQGQNYISGYTMLKEGLYNNVPAIIFGDHTRVLKYIDTPCFLGADGVKLLKVKIPNANTKYLYYRLCATNIPNTGYNRHFKWLKEVDIELPKMEEQEKIVSILDKVCKLIDERNIQLIKLDNLVKSRFIEMFGDVIKNSKNWNVMTWNNVLTIKNGRNQKQVENPNGQYPICGSGGIMSYADDFISNENSVIIGRKGNINKPILMREKFWNVDTAFGLEPNTHTLLVDYLYLFCVFFDFETLNKAVTIPSLTKTDLLNIKIPIPPIELQNDFATFVEQTDKLKFEVKQSLEQLETLKKSLMQQYFG